MKKLMTMIAAVATAFGLYAADSGTSFEGASAGKLSAVYGGLTELDTEVQDKSGYWSFDKDDTAEVVAFGASEVRPANRPAQYVDEGDYYLKLSSGTNLLKRNYATSGSFNAVSKSLYLDSVVKMTAFDADPEITDAKLAVWLRDTSDNEGVTDPSTNLMVTVAGVNYNCGNRPALLETWARVTIKALPIGGEKIGLAVWINETPVTCDALDYTGITLGNDYAKQLAAEHALFVPDTEETTITYAGFAGIGSIDDLVFTEVAPDFAKDYTFKKVAWDDGVTGFTCGLFQTNGLTAAGNVTFQYEDTLPPTVSDVTYAAGKMAKEIKDVEGVETIVSQDAGAIVTINNVDTPYATAAAAIAAINGMGEVAATLKLQAATSAGFDLDNEDAEIVLDLAGKTIEGENDVIVVSAGTLTITNSTDEIGKVVATDGNAVKSISDSSLLNITAGIFDGTIKGEEECLYITDGKFLKTANDAETLNGFRVADETREFIEDGDYLVLGIPAVTKGTVIFICEKNGAEYSRVTNDTYDVGTTIAKADFPTFDLDSDVWTLTWNQDSVTVAETETEVTATATIEFTGEGTEAAPYQIASAVDFKKVQAAVADGENFAEEFLVLANDVDMSGIAWEGIGNYNGGSGNLEPDFRGTLNGAGYTIQNITFARGEYYGFFNQLENATISNITFNVAGFADGTETSYGAGVVANWVTGTTFDHVTVTGTLEGSHNVAGIAIKACGGTTFKDCVNNATITCTGSKRAGGLVGFESSTSGGVHFIRCTNNGNITAKYANSADYAIGGIMAAANGQSITFEDCANYGTVAFSTEMTGVVRKGAFIGWVDNQKITATGSNTMKIIDGLDAIGTLSGTATETGFDYATEITDTQVTFSELAEGGTFTLMKADLEPAFTLEAIDDTITFKTNLFEAASFEGIVTSDPAAIALKEEADAEGVTFTAVAKSTDPRDANPQTPAEVETALGNLGVSDLAKANIKTVEDFAAFDGYFKAKTQSQTWDQVTDGQKANAYLCYALNATAIPNAEITDDDVTIDSFANGVIEIAIEGVEAGAEVPAAMIAKVIDVIGNNALTDMTADKVQVSGQATANGKVQVTVAPAEKITDTSKFFYRASVKK